MLTVEEVWRAALPAGTRLAAGRNSLYREVVWAVTLRSAAPGFAVLRGGEIALISTSSLRQLDERLTLARALDRLAESSIVAAAVSGDAQPDAVHRAEELGIPLFILP